MADIQLEKLAENIALGRTSLMEGNPRRRFEAKLHDRSNVHQFIIVSPQNPHFPDMVQNADDASSPLEAMKSYLKRGNFGWVPTKGQYGEEERSFLIPNMSKEEGEHLARRFGQESFIFGHKNDNGDFTYEFWKTKDGTNYYLMSAKDSYERNDEFDDYYTTHKSGMRFSIPFEFDESVHAAISEYDTYIEENCSQHMGFDERQKLIAESLDPKKSGRHRWIARAEIMETDRHFYRMQKAN